MDDFFDGSPGEGPTQDYATINDPSLPTKSAVFDYPGASPSPGDNPFDGPTLVDDGSTQSDAKFTRNPDDGSIQSDTKFNRDAPPNLLGINSTNDPNDILGKLLKGIGGLGSSAKSMLSTPAGQLALMYALNKYNKPKPSGGYQGGIDMGRTMAQTRLPAPAPTPYGAGRMGRQYFTPVQYAAQGGIMGLAQGGGTNEPRYLRGGTDGMADKLDTTIDGHQAAKLSHGEFVIPADVVSHLGNGNSDAGAEKLYALMDKVRQARTGTKEQGKRINPDKFLPNVPGSSKFAGGGIIAFDGGGATPTTPGATPQPNPNGQGNPGSLPVSQESNLSNWVGPYVTGMLGDANALGNTPYQAYTGPLTAGTSPLQQQAFNAAGNLGTPSSFGKAENMIGNAGTGLGSLSYDPTKFSTNNFDASAAQQYMNPYLQMSLDPQIAEARRQQQITNLGSQAKLTAAGAFGGGRDAIMRSEADRNLGTNLANITGQGYNTAFNNAQQQFNADQNRSLQAQQGTEQSKQFGANLGLQGLQGQLNAGNAMASLGTQQSQTGLANLKAQMDAGATQRGIESEGINADRAQFEQELADPYKKLQFKQSMLQGLPVGTTTSSTGTTPLGDLGQTLNTINNPQLKTLIDQLFGTNP